MSALPLGASLEILMTFYLRKTNKGRILIRTGFVKVSEAPLVIVISQISILMVTRLLG
jgi:hypothetical protein